MPHTPVKKHVRIAEPARRHNGDHLTAPGFRRSFRRAGVVRETRSAIVASRAHLEELMTRLVRHQEALLNLSVRRDKATGKSVSVRRTLNERTVSRAFAEVFPGLKVYSGEA
jgi:hypothetical protein